MPSGDTQRCGGQALAKEPFPLPGISLPVALVAAKLPDRDARSLRRAAMPLGISGEQVFAGAAEERIALVSQLIDRCKIDDRTDCPGQVLDQRQIILRIADHENETIDLP